MIITSEKKQYYGWAYLFMWPLGGYYIDTEKSNAEILVWCEKNLQGIYRIGGLFADFGDFFNQNRGGTEAVYLEGYGALFLITTDFPLAPPPSFLRSSQMRYFDTFVLFN